MRGQIFSSTHSSSNLSSIIVQFAESIEASDSRTRLASDAHEIDMSEAVALVAVAEEKPFPFLLLPPEIRNQIYRYLYWWQGRRVAESREWLDTAVHPHLIHKRPYREDHPAGEFGPLVALMRTCRQLHTETVTFLYAPVYAVSNIRGFHSWNLRFFSDNGPARHLRHVRVEFGRLRYRFHRDIEPDPAPTIPQDDEVTCPNAMPYIESVLRALAQNATQLETLELSMRGQNSYPEVRSDGWPVKPEYSWMDSPVGLPGLVRGRGLLGKTLPTPPKPTEGEMSGILEFIAPGDSDMQGRVKQMIEESPICPVYLGGDFWKSVWFHIWFTNGQKLFWGKSMMDVLHSFSPTLRTVTVVGAVDRRWMVAVANLADVTVRAKTGREESEWITVSPGGAVI
ncbi:hypothetical protein B0T16DRAFT_406553 [Cercophora newfieldiana]|uniref:Uncharacterized protein n=1 Tax=Cercophora newfieldiana TaxID=92897 RepID=A0AA40CV48_9PEZI|nr:hypothetical protein B0T16DRAFT_406553 [Cercophora newfieldiana]